ncbi:MAG: signal peptidase I [Candidatus Roizmanbacteria bacterium]|nr:signal peptidase I [Candidatus Roizmanbacteria bacterium]
MEQWSLGKKIEEGKPINKSPAMRVVDFLFDILQQIALGGAFFVVFYIYIAQPNMIRGSSMLPTFKDKEYILTDKITYKLRQPQRGEVVILQSPANADIDFIKRIIGLPGDSVSINNGKVYLNERELSEPYISVYTPVFPGGFLKEGDRISIPQGSFFVLGDNRPGSSDSREYGLIPFKHIIGRVVFRYFPIARAGFVTTPVYAGN